MRQRQLQLTVQRTVAACKDAQAHAAGDAAIPCAGNRDFPITLGDTALYVTDMQGDFLLREGRIGQHYSDEDMAAMEPVIDNATRLVTAARKAGLTIAYGRSHRFGAQVRRDLICPRESEDTYNVLEAIRPRPEDIVVDKCTWGIFASTDLEAQLRSRGVRRLIVIGVATNVCVTNAVFQAVDRFFRVCLVPEACGAFDRAWHDQAVSMLNGPQIRAATRRSSTTRGCTFARRRRWMMSWRRSRSWWESRCELAARRDHVRRLACVCVCYLSASVRQPRKEERRVREGDRGHQKARVARAVERLGCDARYGTTQNALTSARTSRPSPQCTRPAPLPSLRMRGRP